MRNKKKYSLLVLVAFAFLLGACASGYKSRETALQEWLTTAKRPVKVTKHHPYRHFSATRGSYYYTLIDSEGKIYLAKNVRFDLPEVIE